jgi:hypothetical protein
MPLSLQYTISGFSLPLISLWLFSLVSSLILSIYSDVIRVSALHFWSILQCLPCNLVFEDGTESNTFSAKPWPMCIYSTVACSVYFDIVLRLILLYVFTQLIRLFTSCTHLSLSLTHQTSKIEKQKGKKL